MAQTLAALVPTPRDKPWFAHHGRDELITGRADSIAAPEAIAQHLHKARTGASGQNPLLYGWPVVVMPSSRRDGRRQIAPMFVVRVEHARHGGKWRLTAAHEAEFNAAALANPQDSAIADEIHALALPAGDAEGMVKAATQAAILMGLNAPHLDPESLESLERGPACETGVHNSAMFLVADFASYRWLVDQDLRRLRDRSDWGSTAAGWLAGQAPAHESRPQPPLAAPLPTSQAQALALESIRTKPLTLVTGPPGTGKTQLVVNAVANAWLAGESVLLASTNNAAVDVATKRADDDVHLGLLMRTGNQERKKDVAPAISSALTQARRYAGETPEAANRALKRTNEDLQGILSQMNDMENLDRQLTSLTQDRLVYEAELVETLQSLRLLPTRSRQGNVSNARTVVRAAGCAAHLVRSSLNSGRRFNRGEVEGILEDAEDAMKSSITSWLKRRTLCKRAGARRNADLEEIVLWARAWLAEKDAAQDLRSWAHDRVPAGQALLRAIGNQGKLDELLEAERLITEAEEQFAVLRQQRSSLQNNASTRPESDVRQRLQTLSERSLRAVRASVASTLLEAKGRVPDFAGVPLKSGPFSKEVARAIHVFHGWACTAMSGRGNFPLRAGLFDLVIIDEASQCSVADILPLAYRARRLAVVGDPNQLRAITTLGDAHLQQIAKDTNNNEDHLRSCGIHHKDGSAYAAFSHAGPPPVMLDEHYRCHPRIAKWFNEAFYGGRLSVLTDVTSLGAGSRTLQWLDITSLSRRPRPGRRRGGWVNEEQAEAIVSALEIHVERGLTIGVVAPYAAQAALIQRMAEKRIGKEALDELDFISGTAHRLQGDERDIILFSTALTPNMPKRSADWIEQERNLINVAVSRARRMLLVTGHPEMNEENSRTLASLRNYILSIDRSASGTVPVATHSDAERLLLDAMRRQGLKPLGKMDVEGFELDFGLVYKDRKINVEVDGDHHLDTQGRQRRSDMARDEMLSRFGWSVLRIPAWRCHCEPDQAASEVKAAISAPPIKGPRSRNDVSAGPR